MSDPEKPKPPESPTTARELDFDDEPLETPASPLRGATNPKKDGPTALVAEDVAPPKPPRPADPMQQAETTLKEAFPTIDAAVVRAVLRASGGNVEPAFNALLEMSDPDAQVEPVPPPKPPRRTQSPLAPTTTAQSQLAADEQYARQLAEHYNGAAAYAAPRQGSRGGQQNRGMMQKQNPRQNDLYDDEERERSFIDDDLPVIRDSIKKGFLETQSKVNSWVTNLRKKIDGDDDEAQSRPAPATGFRSGYSQSQYGGRGSSDFQRRSQDQDRYDADPQVLGDDFTKLHLKEAEAPQRRSSRPLANPDLFKPTPSRPQGQGGRRVSFQEGPPETIGIQSHPTPDPSVRPSSGGGKASKWQPLAAVDPSPVTDHDPFSLGDSDEEEYKKKDVRADDSERLKQAAAEAMSENIGADKKLEPHERSGSQGTRDKETEKLVSKT